MANDASPRRRKLGNAHDGASLLSLPTHDFLCSAVVQAKRHAASLQVLLYGLGSWAEGEERGPFDRKFADAQKTSLVVEVTANAQPGAYDLKLTKAGK